MITVPVACVVDASVAVKLVVTEPHSSVAHDLFAHLGADPSARRLRQPGESLVREGNLRVLLTAELQSGTVAPRLREKNFMAITSAGVVKNGVVVPNAPLPEGAFVEVPVIHSPIDVPPELQEEFDAWERAGAGTVE